MPLRLIAFTLALSATTVVATAQEITSSVSDPMLGVADQLRQSALSDTTAYETVRSLTTEIGPRLAGSDAEERARAWAVKKLKSLGFKNVRVEEFEIPFWDRLSERAEITSPFPQPLMVTALGGSPGTGPEGVEGEIISFPSVDALAELDDGSLRGKIVFIDEIMTRTQDGSGYGHAAKKRRETAYEAHRLGAEAALIRSVGTSSHRFPHTGQMQRVTAEPREAVPTAALSAPDADQLVRSLAHGKPVVVRIALEVNTGSTAKSGNVIAEIPGRERPAEIVLIGAHLDSWDLGTGAVDDGAGIGVVIGAGKVLMDSLKTPPKRTVRIVLFGAEEVGLAGAKAYAELHRDELADHVVGTESDFGAGKIWRFDTRFGEGKTALAAPYADALKPLGIAPGHNRASGGPDMKYIREAGVPVVGMLQNGWDYFDLHHTPNDTFDKIDPDNLAQIVAAFSIFTYLAAESDDTFR